MFLTQAEVAELTGTTRRARQAEWLARQGIIHWQNLANRVIVPVSAIEGQARRANEVPAWRPNKAYSEEPNWAAMNPRSRLNWKAVK